MNPASKNLTPLPTPKHYRVRNCGRGNALFLQPSIVNLTIGNLPTAPQTGKKGSMRSKIRPGAAQCSHAGASGPNFRTFGASDRQSPVLGKIAKPLFHPPTH